MSQFCGPRPLKRILNWVCCQLNMAGVKMPKGFFNQFGMKEKHFLKICLQRTAIMKVRKMKSGVKTLKTKTNF